MKWKYSFHHAWDENRTDWAEAFVRPNDADDTVASLWVTVVCAPADSSFGREDIDADLVVDARDFTQSEFLHYVTVWLREQGMTVTELVPATLEDFAGTHAHADFLIHLRRTANPS